MKSILLAVVFILQLAAERSFAASTAVRAKKIEDLQQRISELEKKQSELSDWYNNFYVLGKSRVSSALKNKISLGGYFETGIINIYGEDTENQLSAYSHDLGINISAEFSESARFVTQALTIVNIPFRNQHNNSQLTPSTRKYAGLVFGSLVAQGYFEYSFSDFFNIQSGIGYAPFGIAHQQRELFLFHARGGPQFINADGYGIAIISALWMGLHTYGLLPLAEKTAGYNLYSFTPGSNVKTLGVGGRLWWAVSEMITTGISAQYGNRETGSFLAQGFDIDIKYKNFGLISEYGLVNSSGDAGDLEAYYIEPYYKFRENKWLFYLSAEYLHEPGRRDSATRFLDAFEKKFFGAGVNWLPISNAKLRLGYLKHIYLNEPDNVGALEKDYDAVEFSTAIAF